MIRRRHILAAPSLLLPGASRAQAPFPDRTVRYVVPFPPGGLTDIMARLVGQKLSEIWSRPVVIENRAGGNALIGADAVAKAAPDGHTLLAITMTHTVNATLFPNAPFDFRRDLTTISVLGSLPLVVVVNAETQPGAHAGRPGAAGEDAPAEWRDRPATGRRRISGWNCCAVRRGAGDNITHVPYRGGAPSVTDLVAGNLDVMVSNLPECIAQIQGGRLRALAVTSAERHPLIPDVPTVHGSRPADARDDQLDRDDGARRACPRPSSRRSRPTRWPPSATPMSARRARDGGFTVEAWDRARSLPFVTEETARWARLIQEAGLRAD